MFIDFLTLVLINLVAGLFIVAAYLFKGLDQEDQHAWAAPFFGVGLISLLTGLQISFTWPLPSAYNIAFGDTTTLFGAVLLIAAIALWKGWSLTPASILGFFAGIPPIIFGIRIYNLQITQSPLLASIGFVLAGLAGVLSAPFMLWWQKSKVIRVIAIILLLAAAGVWFVTYVGSAWDHMTSFASWAPVLGQ